MLIIKQEVLWVELYFRDGRLMCIGPVRPNATLGDRLLQAGVISKQDLQEAISTIDIAQPGETRIALTLMDLGYVSHERLRAWATKEAREVIQVLLTWQSGEISFEERQPPPTDRLLVALSHLDMRARQRTREHIGRRSAFKFHPNGKAVAVEYRCVHDAE